jgi:pyruvate dehydrogenase E1 component beta subunit
MPSVTPSMKDGKIARWHVAEGQAVAAGDLLVEVVTSSATLEIEAENEGHVERILVPAGTEGVKVNTPIAVLLGFASLEASPRSEPQRAAAPRIDVRRADGQGLTYREALRDALADEMQRDPDVFLIGVDVTQNRGAQRVAQGLADAFGPRRVVSVPALDEAALGLAVGAAYAGLKPVVEVGSWGRALNEIWPALMGAAETFYLSGGKLPVPIVFRGPNGFSPGMTGEESRCVASLLAGIPGLKVVQPATAAAAGALLTAAIRDPGPVVVLEHTQLYATRDDVVDKTEFALGHARIARAGTDVTITAAGHSLVTALAAARALSDDGISAEVVDLMSLRPLDRDTIVASVARTRRLLTVEDGWGAGGIGAEIVASVVAERFDALKSPPKRVAGAPVPMPYATDLQAQALPTAEEIARAVTVMVRGS